MSNRTLQSGTSEKKHHLDGDKPSEFYNFLADIEDLVQATNLLTGEELVKAKAELSKRINSAKVSMTDVSHSIAERAQKTANITNTYAHDKPWQVIGAGSAIGFLLGYLLARRG